MPHDATAPTPCACRAIDVHAHVVPAAFPRYAGCHAEVPWPSMEHTDRCRANVIIAGKVFRAIDARCWTVERRLEWMDRAGIAHQALSPMPELLSYWMAPEDAAALGDHVNATIAEMVIRAPDRFVGLGMVPLQDVDRAIQCLERLIGQFGFAGVEIGTHVAGVSIGDPRLAPFFAAAEAMSAAIFVHALHPVGRERLVGPTGLGPALLFPCDVALAAASVLTGGLLDRHPTLRIGFSHGGGALGLLLPRLAHVWRLSPAIREAMATDPMAGARRLYYDTLVYDRDTLRFLVDRFGADQLFLGSDFPFQIHEADPVGRVDELTADAALRRALTHDNAARFLGLATATSEA